MQSSLNNACKEDDKRRTKTGSRGKNINQNNFHRDNRLKQTYQQTGENTKTHHLLTKKEQNKKTQTTLSIYYS